MDALHIIFNFISLIVTLYLLCLLIRTIMKNSIRRCESTASMNGKVIVVTGGNQGIGFFTAKDLAARGGTVILACRNESRGIAAREKIITETGNENVKFKYLNLSSLKSVREFARDFKKSESRLDVLINNAGVHGFGDRFTEDNIIEGMQVNHFSNFLLTILLLPMLKKSKGRIVNVSSLCHFRGEINFEKINKVNSYSSDLIYANGKLCNLVFTKELARRLEGTGVTANALHPGVTLTNIVSEERNLITWILFTVWCWFCCRTVEEGAQTSIYLSVADEVKHTTGKYFVDCKERFVLWRANDPKLGKEFWEYSERIVDLTNEERTMCY